jgi:hypothetical protein
MYNRGKGPWIGKNETSWLALSAAMMLCLEPAAVPEDGIMGLGEVAGTADTTMPDCGGRPEVRYKTAWGDARDGAEKRPASLIPCAGARS